MSEQTNDCTSVAIGSPSQSLPPLHRAFRFWLPAIEILTFVLPQKHVPRQAVLEIFGDTNRIPLMLSAVLQFILPWKAPDVLFVGTAIAWWYLVGLVLDQHDPERGSASEEVPGYFWAVTASALFGWMSAAWSLDLSYRHLDFFIPGKATEIIPVVSVLSWIIIWAVVLFAVRSRLLWFRGEVSNSLESSEAAGSRRQGRWITWARPGGKADLRLGIPVAAVCTIFLVPVVGMNLYAAVPLTLLLIVAYSKWLWPELRVERRLLAAWWGWYKSRRFWRYPMDVVMFVTVLVFLLWPWNSDYKLQHGLGAAILGGVVLSLALLNIKWFFPTVAIGSRLREAVLWTRARRMRDYVILAGVLWILGCMAIEDRQLFAKAASILLAVVAIRIFFPKGHSYRWIFWAGLLILSVLAWAGSYDPIHDVVFLACAFAISYSFWSWGAKRRIRHLQLKSCVLLLCCAWIFCSAGDMLPRDSASTSGQRFLNAAKQTAAPPKRIGIALSGGGYRAALLHAGILSGLETLGMPVTNISSVSGGSIIGAYYTLGGSPEEFLETVIHHKFDFYRDVVDLQNSGRLIYTNKIPGTQVQVLPGYSFSRTNLQAEALDRVLLHHAHLKDLPPGSPKLMICVTDLNSGRAIGISNGWMMSRFLLRPPGEEQFSNATDLYSGIPRISSPSTFRKAESSSRSLSDLVAASGAFPLAFSPLKLISKDAGNYLLADGGVTDNSGMTLLLDADWRASLGNTNDGDKDWGLDLAISADGGAMFKQAATSIGAPADPNESSSLEAVGRAVDIIHSRIGLRVPVEPRGPVRPQSPPMFLLSPSLYVDNSVPNSSYEKLAIESSDIDIPHPVYDLHAFSGRVSYFYPVLTLQQQKLVELITKQISTLDYESLPLLGRLNGVSPESYRLLVYGTDDMDKKGFDQQSQLQILRRLPGPSKDRQLLWIVKLISEDFSKCLQSFMLTPTLEDDIPERDARNIFRLGQYLVFLNAHELRRELNPPSTPNAAPASVLNFAEAAKLSCEMQIRAKRGTGDTKSLDVCLTDRAAAAPAKASGLAAVRRELGHGLLWKGALDNAAREYEEALASDNALSDWRGVGRDLIGLAQISLEKEDFANARHRFEDAFAASARVKDEDSEAAALLGLSAVLYRQGDLNQSLQSVGEADALLRSHENDHLSAMAHALEGEILFAEGNASAARRQYEQVEREWPAANGNEQRSFMDSFNARYADYQKGDDESYAEHDYDSVTHFFVIAAARLAIDSGAVEDAEARLHGEARYFDGTAADRAVEVHVEYARVLWALNRRKNALRELDYTTTSALGTTQSVEPRIRLAEVTAQIDSAHGNLARAEAQLKSAVADAKKIGDVPAELESSLALGKIEIMSGEFAVGSARLSEVSREAARHNFRWIANEANRAKGTP
jgi:NTE family protein